MRAFWSGTITFGLVSIPVDFYAAARPRQKAMRLVDSKGHALGRQYTREADGKPLSKDEIIRGFEPDEGEMVTITDQELESAAPETSRDIELSRFVPLEQIPPFYFVRPYFLAPTTRAGKAYSLLAQTMQRTGKVGIGRLVMRGHEYMVAIIADAGALRAETLRYFDELRTPETVGLPAAAAPARQLVRKFAKEIERLEENRLDLHELEDRESEALQQLAERKAKRRDDVVTLEEDEQPEERGAEIVDLMQLLRRSLGATAAQQPAAGRNRPESGDLRAKTRDELYKMAGQLKISGRSKMKKAALIQSIQAAQQRTA